MEITIDQDKITGAINQTATKAVQDSLGSYNIRRAIAEVVTTEVAEGAIAEAIRQAVKQMDTNKLMQHLAAELHIRALLARDDVTQLASG